MIQLLKMAFRDLGRNRRRSFFSSLALGLGLAILLLMAAFINGEMNGAMDSTIRLQSGHLQIRAQTYNETKTSLLARHWHHKQFVSVFRTRILTFFRKHVRRSE